MGEKKNITQMVPHVVPPRQEVRVHVVVLVPDELAEEVEAVEVVEDAQPDDLRCVVVLSAARTSITQPAYNVDLWATP